MVCLSRVRIWYNKVVFWRQNWFCFLFPPLDMRKIIPTILYVNEYVYAITREFQYYAVVCMSNYSFFCEYFFLFSNFFDSTLCFFYLFHCGLRNLHFSEIKIQRKKKKKYYFWISHQLITISRIIAATIFYYSFFLNFCF